MRGGTGWQRPVRPAGGATPRRPQEVSAASHSRRCFIRLAFETCARQVRKIQSLIVPFDSHGHVPDRREKRAGHDERGSRHLVLVEVVLEMSGFPVREPELRFPRPFVDAFGPEDPVTKGQGVSFRDVSQDPVIIRARPGWRRRRQTGRRRRRPGWRWRIPRPVNRCASGE
jgi:hypothetical protein